MSRQKKSRKPGSLGIEEVIVTRNRSESDVEGRLRKRLRKRKGLKTGNRHSAESKKNIQTQGVKKDPRIGSKKPIPLIVETKKPSKVERHVSAQKELEQIQNDPQLNILIDRLDNGEKLGSGLQAYVDQKLDRLAALMSQLGIEIDDEEDDLELESPKPSQDKSKSSTSKSDHDLFEQFENIDINSFHQD